MGEVKNDLPDFCLLFVSFHFKRSSCVQKETGLKGRLFHLAWQAQLDLPWIQNLLQAQPLLDSPPLPVYLQGVPKLCSHGW